MFVSTHGIVSRSTVSGCTAVVGTNIQVGTGTSTDNRYPAYGLYDYSHQMFMYTSAQIGSGQKQITGISFNMASYTVPYTFLNQTLKLAHCTDVQFGTSVQILNTNGDISGVNGVTDLTIVKANFTWTINPNGWRTVNFDTNFCYNGTSTLLVIWENRDGSWTTGYGTAQTSVPTGFQSWYKEQDTTYPTGFGTRNSAKRPNIRLNY